MGGDHAGFFQLKFNLEEISSIITVGRTSSPNTRGENLELTIVFPVSSSRLYDYLFVRPLMLEVVHLTHSVAASGGCVLTGSCDKIVLLLCCIFVLIKYAAELTLA